MNLIPNPHMRVDSAQNPMIKSMQSNETGIINTALLRTVYAGVKSRAIMPQPYRRFAMAGEGKMDIEIIYCVP